MAERLDRETGVAETTDRGSAARAAPRWQLLEGAVIGDTPSRADLVLVHPELGLALFQLEPRWTPNALEWLRQRLDASGFSSAFPGQLPAIHRRLRREDIPEIATILAEAFSLQPSLTLPPGGAWVEALRRALSAEPEAPTGSAPEDIATSLGRVTQETAAPEAPRALEPRAAVPDPAFQPPVAELPSRPTAAATSAPSPSRRNNRPLVIGAGALAAGLLLVAVLRGPSAPEGEPPGPPQRLAAAGPVAARTDAAPEAPVAAIALAQAPAPERPETSGAPAAPIEEPPAPELEAALAALAREAEPPLAPIEEPPAPELGPALAALAREAEPPLAPIEEPPAPELGPALAALAREAEPPPQSTIAQPAAPVAIGAPPPVTPLPVPDPPAVIGAMLLRGQSLLRIGDISGARRFFERAAASGSGAAALAMGGTYDPGVLASLGARGITPDRGAALAWYRYAASLGETRAAERIAALEGSR